MIAVDNSLFQKVVNIFIKKEIRYDNENLNLIKYIQPPIAIGKFQINDPRALIQSGGIFRSVNVENEIELAQKTKLKIILSKEKKDYPYVNINGDVFESNFTATYKRGNSKSKAVEHILALVKEGDKVEVYDKYLLSDNGDSQNMDNNHASIRFIEKLINSLNFNVELKISCKNNCSNTKNRKFYLENQFNNRFIFNHHNLNDHDRYIRVYKNNKIIYEIILSSGIYYLEDNNKDLTYVVRIF